MTTTDADIAAITEQLRICLSWCGNRISAVPDIDDISSTFRSRELSKHALNVFPKSCHTKHSDFILHAFSDFTAQRARLISDLASDIAAELPRPKSLLIFNWHCSLFDGAATAETLGFLDDDYMPPWDTWLAILPVPELSYGTHCLLSWVPEALADRIDGGIIVDPAESLSWCSISSNGKLIIHGWGNVVNDAPAHM